MNVIQYIKIEHINTLLYLINFNPDKTYIYL